MGFKTKLFKRFKRHRPTDASTDNTTIATKELLSPAQRRNGSLLLTLGLDSQIPSTPKGVHADNNNAETSPDETHSTEDVSVNTEPFNEVGGDSKKADTALSLVQMGPDASNRGDQSKRNKVSENSECQRVSSVVEYTSAPMDVDEISSPGSVQSGSSQKVQSGNPTKGTQLGKGAADKDEEEKTQEADQVRKLRSKDEPEMEEENPIRNSSSWIKNIEKHIKAPLSDERKTCKVSFDEEEHHIQDDHYKTWGAYEDDDEEDSSYDSSQEYDDDSQYYDDDEYSYGDDIDNATYMSGDSIMLVENDGLLGWLCGFESISPGSLEDREDETSAGTRGNSKVEGSADVNGRALIEEEGNEMLYQQVKPVRTLSSLKMGRKLRVVSPTPRLPSLLKKKEPKAESASPQVKEKKEVAIEATSPEPPQENTEAELPTPEASQEKNTPNSQTAREHFNNQKEATDAQPKELLDSQGFPVKIHLLPKQQAKSPQSTPLEQEMAKKEQDPPADDITVATAGSKHKLHVSGKDSRQLEIYCKKKGGVENLVLRKYSSVPKPAEKHHVLIKVEASTVSSRDCLLRLQGDPDQLPIPSVPGFQVVGTIHSLGDGIKPDGILQIGDRVAALTQGGGNARFISIPASNVILLPPTATNENVICLVSNYMTAYQALKLAKMKKDGAPLTNMNVLITGGSGPIGQALIDLATREGAIVHTTAHQMHQEHLTKNLKVQWYPVNPNKWLPKLEGQMDVVVDSLCVDGYESSYRALSPDGVLICTGNISSQMNKYQTESIFESKKLSLWWSDVKAKHVWRNCHFYNIYESFANDPKLFQQELLYLYLQMENGGIKPKVAGRVSLNQVPKAQRLIEKGLPNGTVILNPWKKLDPKQNVPIERCDNRRK